MTKYRCSFSKNVVEQILLAAHQRQSQHGGKRQGEQRLERPHPDLVSEGRRESPHAEVEAEVALHHVIQHHRGHEGDGDGREQAHEIGDFTVFNCRGDNAQKNGEKDAEKRITLHNGTHQSSSSLSGPAVIQLDCSEMPVNALDESQGKAVMLTETTMPVSTRPRGWIDVEGVVHGPSLRWARTPRLYSQERPAAGTRRNP